MNPENVSLELLAPTREFTVRLSATRRGARLARYLAAQQLDAWGRPYDTEASGVVAQLVAELAANAVQHGHVRGRDFRLRLTFGAERTLRIEVTDACVDRLPCMPSGEDSALGEAESGWGLLIVDTLAHRWGCDTSDSVSKTVWAEIALP